MVQSIGVDLIETARIALALERHGTRFLNRVYTPAEQAYCNGRIPCLAARWAAKEAVAKTLGCGIGDVAFVDIEVGRDARGKPHLILHPRARRVATTLGLDQFHLSLSHTHEYAIAFVVAT